MNIKTIVSLAIIPLTYCVGVSQNTYVPDDNFERALIELGLDAAPLNDFVPTANINSLTVLDIHDKNISDLTGIEDFAALSVLNCDNNNLTNLNISQNKNLTQLFCRFNQLTSLDTSQNINLNILWVEANQLTEFDVTNNVTLISLITNNNPLHVLDVTNNSELRVLYCENNQLANLDISKNLLLRFFNANYNALTRLDTSNNSQLTEIACGNNLIASLDLTKNTQLENLVFEQNQISSIDLKNNIKLSLLWSGRNRLTSLDVSNNILLESLLCDFNNITTLDLSKNNNLVEFGCDSNNLCYLNIKNGNNTNITQYSSTNNPYLSCIFVDTIDYSTTNWTEIDTTSNFVTSQVECDVFGDYKPPVDTLNDFVGIRYTLPTISNGHYFTEPNGNGTALNAGDVVTTSQTIYIFNDTDCYSNETHFKVTISDGDYYIPKFFTPNNDGTHDYWQVFDNSNTIHTITIYNRYGKLLKSLVPNSEGWNGTFSGRLLESDDYWYAITFHTGNTIKGHFTLKR